MIVLKTWRLIQETSEEKLFYWSSIDSLTYGICRDLLDKLDTSSTLARSIELYEFRNSRSEFRLMLMYLFRISFLTTLDIYIRLILRAITHEYSDQELNFLCEKLLRLYWDPCKRVSQELVTDWRFVHQRKEGYYKIKSNWILERKFNCRLVFWDRLG